MCARPDRRELPTAATNQQLAHNLTREPPDDGRREYGEGYAAALRGLAEEQLRMARQESLHG